MLRVGVYIDNTNLTMNGGRGMRYDVLRDFACRGGAEPLRLNIYVSYDVERARQDPEYRQGQQNFQGTLRDFGYKVIRKPVKWYTDDQTGEKFGKANVDLDMAVDAVLQAETLDRVVLATGDGDFVQVVRALQHRGCRVELVAFDSVSGDLVREADLFMPGYLVPNLLETGGGNGKAWGELGSRVRGVCYYRPAEKNYGFLRVMRAIGPELWKIDSRQAGSPYMSVFFHDSELPPDISTRELPSRRIIFEFELAEGEGSLRAVNMRVANKR